MHLPVPRSVHRASAKYRRSPAGSSRWEFLTGKGVRLLWRRAQSYNLGPSEAAQCVDASIEIKDDRFDGCRAAPRMPDRRGNEISKGLPENISHRRELSGQLKNISGPSGSSGSQTGICASERLQARIRADRNRVFFPVFVRLARWSGCSG